MKCNTNYKQLSVEAKSIFICILKVKPGVVGCIFIHLFVYLLE